MRSFLSLQPVGYQSISTLDDDEEKFDIEARVARSIDPKAAALTKDAEAFKIVRGKLKAQRQLLAKANTIASNIETQILKYRRLMDYCTEKLELSDTDTQRAQFIAKKSKAQKDETRALQRKARVAQAIPVIENTLGQLRQECEASANKFIAHYPTQFYFNEKTYLAFLWSDVLYTPFVLKTAGLSVISFAVAWHLTPPSRWLAFGMALPPALLDLALNLLLFDARDEAINTTLEYYENYKFKSYQQIAYEAFQSTVYNFSLSALALGTFNQIILLEHNLLGGAANYVGIEDYPLIDTMNEALRAIFVIAPILITAYGYYSKTLNDFYFEGMKNNKAYKLVINTFRKLFSEDFPRAFDVLYSGLFSSCILRALSFYYLAHEVGVNPDLAFWLVLHHTIVTRYWKAYDPSFKNKEHALVKIFEDLQIKKAHDKVIEGRTALIYDGLLAENPRRNEDLKQLAKAKFKETLVTCVLEEIRLEALKLAAGMEYNFTRDARLLSESQQQRALKRIRAQAVNDAGEYLEDQTDELLELRTWEDFFTDLKNSALIGSLRGVFGYTLAYAYSLHLLEAIDDDYFSDEAANIFRLTSALMVGLGFFVIYFNSCKQSALDAKVVACHTDDDINNPDETITPDYTTERELVEHEVDILPVTTSHALAHPDLMEQKQPQAPVRLPTPAPTTNSDTHSTLKIAKVLAATIMGGSCVGRLYSGVYTTTFRFMGTMDPMVLVSLVTLSLAEQQIVSYRLYISSMERSIQSRLFRSKYKQANQDAIEQKEPSPRLPSNDQSSSSWSSYPSSLWARMKRTVNGTAATIVSTAAPAGSYTPTNSY